MNSYRNQERRLQTRKAVFPDDSLPSGSRSVVLEAALTLFAERGFAGASIRDIGAEAGIKSASLYAHYASKEHILSELILIAHRELHQRLKNALLDAGSDPCDQVRALVRAHVSAHAEFQMLAVVANSEMHMLSEELRAESLFLRHESESLLVDVVRRGVLKGVFNVPDETLAVAMIGAAGIRTAHWFDDELGVSAEYVSDTFGEYALRVLGARNAGQKPTATVAQFPSDKPEA